ncbi:MAG TPA: hypothetical protein VK859_15760 [bacterium]|nr:hypothetical protein [bacterium]
MKRFMKALAVLILLAGPALPATNPGTPATGVKDTARHQLDQRFRRQVRSIQMDEKSGKISHTQASALRDQLRAVRKLHSGFVQANQGKPMTSAQVSQVSQSLSLVEKAH